jgi:hypothetical protein
MSNNEGAAASNDTGFAACLQQCCAGIWQKLKEGRRKTQARWVCAISVIGCSLVAITSIATGCIPTILIAMSASSRFPHVKQYNCIPHFILAAALTAAQIHFVRHSAGRAAFLPRLDPVRQNMVRICCAVSGAVLGACAGLHRVRALVYLSYTIRAHVSRSTGLGWCFAYNLDNDCWWIIFWGIALMLSGVLYAWAYVRGERFEDEVRERSQR